jgi:hypothetical protein
VNSVPSNRSISRSCLAALVNASIGSLMPDIVVRIAGRDNAER